MGGQGNLPSLIKRVILKKDMKVVSQLEEYNKRETEKFVKEERERQFSPRSSIHEAATMAGEMIARINNGHKTTAEEVINTYKPGYLKNRR